MSESFTIRRVDTQNADFVSLVASLDRDLAIRDGADHDFYANFNHITPDFHAVVAYIDGQPAGCGAWKELFDDAVEIKRMYTTENARKMGVATAILQALEEWAKEMAFAKCMLETGINQPEAIKLYENRGYVRIANYGQYADVPDSRCFEKWLKQ